MSNRSPKNNWFSENQNFHNKKQSFSQERKGVNLSVNQNGNDINKAFGSFKNQNNFKNIKSGRTNQLNITGNQYPFDITPQNNLHNKNFSEIYNGKSGIGKIQPVSEIKT